MKGPSDIEGPELTGDEPETLQAITDGIERHFAQGSDSFSYAISPTHRQVFREKVLETVLNAGWDARIRGQVLLVRRP